MSKGKKGWRRPSRGRPISRGSGVVAQRQSVIAPISAYFIILVGAAFLLVCVLFLVGGLCLICKTALARRRRVSAHDLGHALVELHEIHEELDRCLELELESESESESGTQHLNPTFDDEQCKGWRDSFQDLVAKVELMISKDVSRTMDARGRLEFCSTCHIPSKQAVRLLETATHLSAQGKSLLAEAVRRNHNTRTANSVPVQQHDRFLLEIQRLIETSAGNQAIETAVDLAIQGRSLSFAARWKHHTFDFVARVLKYRTFKHLPATLLWSTLHGKVLGFVERETTFGASSSSSSSSVLGISGMRGVGKTTLLRFVRDCYLPAVGLPFNYIFFLGAGTGCNQVDRLRHVLSDNIGLSIDDDVPLAKLISSHLEGTSFLLLIDDVRERLDLAALGLPMPLGYWQKVIFTTRYPPLCTQMGCESTNTIHMKCLREDDAWSLFVEKVGDEIINAHPHINRLANKMVAECRGLPSALCALGRAMSTKRDVKEWRYAYDVLLKRKPPPHQVDEILETVDQGYSHLHQLEDALARDTCFF